MTDYKNSKQLFGTNGIRGVIGRDMTPDMIFKVSKAFGAMRQGTIAIGRDSRTSGITLGIAAISGLLSIGCDVVDCGILPTPALQYIVKNHFEGGVMITASHNPPEYNGIKIIEPDGTEMGEEQTIELEKLIFNNTIPAENWNNVGKKTDSPQLVHKYLCSISNSFPKGIGKGMTVVVDPGSGPACLTTPKILEKMGCKVLTVNSIVDGTFPGRMPEPTAAGLSHLSDLVKASGAIMGLAHDGDADRTVFVDENGQFIEENKEFSIIAQYVCEKKLGIIVTPVSTSQLVETIAKKAGCKVMYTKVGSIFVARTMRSLIQKGENVILGGEGNGGLIFPEHQFCRDGGMTAAMMVSIIASKKIPLSHLVKNLPQRYMIKEKIYANNNKKLLESVKNRFINDKMDLTDGLKIFRDDCWALIRSSGTEPLIRIIIDGPTCERCNTLRDEIMKTIAD